MEREQMSEDTLTVTELKGGGGQQGPVLDDGTYEAEYKNMKIFMDNTPWGEKKAARLYFKITRGKYKDQSTSFKGTFFQDKETQAWIVGSKSKLGDAIRSITGGKTLSQDHAGTSVFVVVKKKTSKTTGNPYSFVENIIPRPADDGAEGLAEAAQATQRPAPAAPRPAVRTSAAQPQPRAVVKPAVPAAAESASEGLLDDLTELSDFKD